MKASFYQPSLSPATFNLLEYQLTRDGEDGPSVGFEFPPNHDLYGQMERKSIQERRRLDKQKEQLNRDLNQLVQGVQRELQHHTRQLGNLDVNQRVATSSHINTMKQLHDELKHMTPSPKSSKRPKSGAKSARDEFATPSSILSSSSSSSFAEDLTPVKLDMEDTLDNLPAEIMSLIPDDMQGSELFFKMKKVADEQGFDLKQTQKGLIDLNSMKAFIKHVTGWPASQVNEIIPAGGTPLRKLKSASRVVMSFLRRK